MLEKLEYIKKWCLQDQSALSSRDVADAVVRMIDDLSETCAAEHRDEADARGQICPSCGGSGERQIHRGAPEECDVCFGTGHI